MLEKIFLVFLCVISVFLFSVTFNFEVLEMDNYSSFDTINFVNKK